MLTFSQCSGFLLQKNILCYSYITNASKYLQAVLMMFVYVTIIRINVHEVSYYIDKSYIIESTFQMTTIWQQLGIIGQEL